MPKVWGWQHLTYLAVCAVLMFLGIFLTKKFVKNGKTLTVVVKVTAFCLLLAIILTE